VETIRGPKPDTETDTDDQHQKSIRNGAEEGGVEAEEVFRTLHNCRGVGIGCVRDIGALNRVNPLLSYSAFTPLILPP
jgi:hypothetical protein